MLSRIHIHVDFSFWLLIFLIDIYLFTFIYVCACACACMYMPQCELGGQRTICRGPFSLLPCGCCEIEHGSSGLLPLPSRAEVRGVSPCQAVVLVFVVWD